MAYCGQMDILENAVWNGLCAFDYHDIGKAGTDNGTHLPWKHCEYGARVFEEMLKEHATTGEQSAFARLGRDLALCHHERYNGFGYPEGLAGREIPLIARAGAVASICEHMTNLFIFPKEREWEVTVASLLANKKEEYDPEIVDVVIENKSVFKEVFSGRSLERGHLKKE